MKRIGIAMFSNKIAAVFNSADRFQILKIIDESIELGENYTIPINSNIIQKIKILKSLEVNKLVCGAISRCNSVLVEQNGIIVEAWICGDFEEIIEKILSERLFENKMPGCEVVRCQRRRRRARKNK